MKWRSFHGGTSHRSRLFRPIVINLRRLTIKHDWCWSQLNPSTTATLGAEFLRMTFSQELFLLWIVEKKRRRRKEKKERKKEREKASKLSKNRTGDNCMSFGNIEKELALLALKSSQSRALKWSAYDCREVFPKWHKIQSIKIPSRISTWKSSFQGTLANRKPRKEELSGIARKLWSPLRCTISCSARFVVEMKGDKMMSSQLQRKCKTRVVLHTILKVPPLTWKGMVSHISDCKQSVFLKIGLA